VNRERAVLQVPPRRALQLYWERLVPVVGNELALHICRTAAEAIRCHPVPQHELGALQAHWYRSLDAGRPDYSVYEAPVYLAEVWYCWAAYSRKYLRQLADLGTLVGSKSIVDLGCGAGYSTAALRQIVPSAAVTGTNVLEGAQGKFCLTMAKHYGFALRANLSQVGQADVVFASEYFEHFDHPVAHLLEVLEQCQPRKLIVANTFTSPSIGHFPAYSVDGAMVDGARASRAFNATLTAAGYHQQKLKMWNNRPAVWTR
jgi:2-polyprenyl-3-methyl-5-hydroxy-6-metoxy-1,4-benzoquinol methylase